MARFTCGISWWRHQIETFSALLALCKGNSPVTCEFPSQRPVTRSFDVFIDLRPKKWLNKQSWGWWFQTSPHSLLRRCYVNIYIYEYIFVYVYISVYVYAGMCVYICICMYMYMYQCSHSHQPSVCYHLFIHITKPWYSVSVCRLCDSR